MQGVINTAGARMALVNIIFHCMLGTVLCMQIHTGMHDNSKHLRTYLALKAVIIIMVLNVITYCMSGHGVEFYVWQIHSFVLLKTFLHG